MLVILPYRLFCLFSHMVAFSDSPVTNFTTVFSICLTCHSLIGKLFCIKKDHLIPIYVKVAYIVLFSKVTTKHCLLSKKHIFQQITGHFYSLILVTLNL